MEKDILHCKIRSRGLRLAHNQEFATVKELKPKIKSVNWEADKGLGALPSAIERFFVIFEKNEVC